MDRLHEARQVCRLFSEAGYPTMLAGGCVRDQLLGQEPKDYDLATTALPQQAIRLLTNHGHKVIPLGLEHGTICVITDVQQLEITTLRHDLVCDGRHAQVAFTDDFQADAERRDFTINALFEDADGKIHDFVGGIEDLRARRLRFVNDPKQRIKEDYLRILRYFRFLARFGWPIQPDQLAAIRDGAAGMQRLSAERIQAEMEKLLLAKHAAQVLATMRTEGVLSVIFPHIAVASDDCERLLASDIPHTPTFVWFSFFRFGAVPPLDTRKLQQALKTMRFSRKRTRNLLDLARVLDTWPQVWPTLTSLLALREKDTLSFKKVREYVHTCVALHLIEDFPMGFAFIQGLLTREPMPVVPRKDLMERPPATRGDVVRLLKICWFLGWCRDKNQLQQVLREPAAYIARLDLAPSFGDGKDAHG